MVLSMVGLLLVNMLVWALEADTVEYGEWKTGVRTEGITYALFSFTRKTGQAVGGALAAYALALGGYVPAPRSQTAEAELGIRVAAGALPAVAARGRPHHDHLHAHRPPARARSSPRSPSAPAPPGGRRADRAVDLRLTAASPGDPTTDCPAAGIVQPRTATS